MKITGNEPASPFRGLDGCLIAKGDPAYSIENGEVYSGITIRQQFAMAAMQGLLANSYSNGVVKPSSEMAFPQLANQAVAAADALIAELNGVKPENTQSDEEY